MRFILPVKTTTLLLLSVSVIGLSGCLSTPYERPALSYPETYPHTAPNSGSYQATDKWWESFNDPELNSLVEAVLAKNNNLAAAGYQLQQARARAGATRWDSLPVASGSLGANQGYDSDGSTGDAEYSARVSLSYEADLWGRLRASRNAAEWEATATAEDLEATRLSLIGSTTSLYWQIAYTHQRIASARESLSYAEKTYQLIQAQYDAGAVSGIELAEAGQNLNTQRNSLSQLEQEQVENRASLSLLLGGEFWPESREATTLPQTVLPDLAPGLPAELLGRRPDLKAAEWRLRATLADVDAARAAMYPTLSLTASGNGASTELSDVLKNPVATLGAGLTLPFLNYPQNKLNVAAAQAGYGVAASNFRQTLLQALTEVDNALSAGQHLSAQGNHLRDTLNAAQKAEALYAIRYREGAVSLRIWLDAQEKLRAAQLAYDNNRLSQLTNRVTLYQALGGQ
ncbi:MAG: efflux transporter outer membrane subunit [Asticcacaulis sp.]